MYVRLRGFDAAMTGELSVEQGHAQGDVDARLAAAQQALDDLRAEVAELRREQRNPPMTAAEVRPEPIVSRRALFGLTGAGIAGVVVGAGASPAGAADGDPVVLGAYNMSTGSTSIESSSGIGVRITTTDAEHGSLALLVESPGDQAVWSISEGDGGVGIEGSATGRGGIGVLGSVGGDEARGVIGAAKSPGGIGVTGMGEVGVQAHSEAGSQLRLVRDAGVDFVGPSSPDSHHDQGEISLDSRGDLFLCTAAGTPGTWTRLNHQGAAFLPNAERAFDSREGRQPIPGGGAKGILTKGGTRTIDLTVATGLPPEARAAIINLTVTDTAGPGYLSVFSGDASLSGTPTFSHVNWTTSGQTIANTTTVTVTDGKIGVYASGSTHAIIDVIGWYP